MLTRDTLLADEKGMALSIRDAEFQLRRRRRISGQGVTEYILLLVVVIMLCGGITWQFNDAFRKWANNYFGEYLSCLLETGELPAIGGTGGQASACDQLFKPFNLADGRPPRQTMNGSGAGSPVGTGPGSGGSPTVETKPVAAKSATESNSSNTSRVNSSGSGSEGVPKTLPNQSNGSGDATQGRRMAYTGSTEAGVPGNISGISGRAGRNKRIELDSGYSVRRDEDQEGRPPLQVLKSTSAAEKAKKSRILITRKLAKAEEEEKDKPMTFGDYLKYILIAALILALILVVGSQIMQVSKEME